MPEEPDKVSDVPCWADGRALVCGGVEDVVVIQNEEAIARGCDTVA